MQILTSVTVPMAVLNCVSTDLEASTVHVTLVTRFSAKQNVWVSG